MQKISKLLGFMACLTVICGIPSAVRADAYNVDDVVGAGSVTGVIDTDGTIGALTSGNITDWNLVLNDGTTTFDLKGPLSGSNSQLDLVGSDLVASSSNLTFDFSSTGFVLFQSPTIGSGMDFWCLEGESCSGNSSTMSLFIQTGAYQITPESGDVVVATAAPTPTPEPSSLSLSLLGSGLLGLALFAGRRKPIRIAAN
jgi:hypothetical protein